MFRSGNRGAPRSRGARRWRAGAGALVLALWGATAAAGASRPGVYVQLPAGYAGGPEAEPAMAVGNEVIVRFRSGAMRARANVEREFGGRLRWLGSRRGPERAMQEEGSAIASMAVVVLPPGEDLLTGVASLGRREDVLYAEPNLRVRVCREPGGEAVGAPSDFEFGRQWALQNTGQTGGQPGADIGALEAWALTTGSREIVAAIIDTGIDYFHPDLEANLWRNEREIPGNGVDDDGNGYIDDVHGYDFVSDDGDPMDDNLHGTHVAGILGAVGDDENGIAGVAWAVRLMALKAFDDSGGGTIADTISAIAYAVSGQARVINASWGTTTLSRSLNEAVVESVGRGVVFVGAAGNGGNEANFYPAAFEEAIAVSATNAKDGSPLFANYGAFVDLVAPGDAIHSTAPNATWTELSGTSMAAPHVSGLAVLLLAGNPSFTPAQLGTILRSTAVELDTGRYTGAGRIDAARAVQVAEPLPTAELRLPAILSGQVELTGEAGGNGFAGYRVELGAGARPSTWTLIRAEGIASRDSVLVPAFDTSAFDDGDYVMRLIVTNRQGQGAIRRVPVALRNVQLASPVNNDIRRHGDLISLRGTVAGGGRTFSVEWGIGHRPTEWLTRGLTLAQGGVAPVIGGELAVFDSTKAPTDSFVTFRVTAFSEGRAVGEAVARLVHLEARFLPGWPVELGFTQELPTGLWREFNVADLDGDGRQEIVLVDHGEPGGRPPRLRVIDATGRTVWERDLPAGSPETDAPVVGDIDGDGSLEILVDTGSGGQIAGFKADGTPLGEGWPVSPGGSHWGKIVTDLDGDGRGELMAVSNPPVELAGARERVVVVIDATGTVRHRWRVEACEEVEVVPEQLPAVANLDDDPQLEIVVVAGCGDLVAFDTDGAGSVLWRVGTDSNLFGSPVAGDLDGDGRDEVIVGGVSRGPGMAGGLHVYDGQGLPRRGWPVLLEESFPAGIALGDVDRDGLVDIVAAGWSKRTVHVVGAHGFELPGWPLPMQTRLGTRSMPVVGDVDGDGWPDIVLASPGSWLRVQLGGDTSLAGGIRAWRGDGVAIDLHPEAAPDELVMESVGGGNWRLPPPVLTDLDGDGTLDVVAATIEDRAYSPSGTLATAKMRSSMYAWTLPVRFDPTSALWPAYQGGPARTGRLYRPPPPNQPPVLRSIPDQTIAVGDTFRRVTLDRYGWDPDGRPEQLVWSVLGARELRFEIDASRMLSIVPPSSNWEGREQVEFVVRDAAGAEVRQAATFSARLGYRPPIAVPDWEVVEEDGEIEIDLLANDRSPTGRPLRLVGVSAPQSGTTERVGDGRVRYRPEADFFGTDTFEYSVADDEGGLATGEVEIEVIGVPDPPIAEPDRIILDEDTTAEIEPLANDRDVDGDDLELVDIEAPHHGTLEPLGQDRFLFIPPPDYFGLQTLNYRLRDVTGLVSTGEVAILVKPVNDPPVVRPQTVTMNRNRAADVYYDATDPDGDSLRFTVVDPPVEGVLLAYPTVANYQPRAGFVGTDRFTYLVSDGNATVGPTSVTLVVVDANNAPDVESLNLVTAQDQELAIGLPVRDVDGDVFTVRIDPPPLHGDVEVTGTNALYRPAPGFLGTDSFGYRASDGKDESRPASVVVRVTDENTAPLAISEVLTVARNRTSPVRLKASDAENNPLQYTVVTNPVYGVISGVAPELEYTPKPAFRGLDRIHFQVRDRVLTSEVAVVYLLVRDPNRPPLTTNQTILIPRDQPSRLRLDAVDPDDQVLRTAILKGPSSGRLFGSGIDYTYVPGPGFTRDSFSYKVWDGFAYSPVATVTLMVRDSPVQVPEIVAVHLGEAGVELHVRGGAGETLRIEGTTDLRFWEPLATVVNSAGTVTWSDVSTAGMPWRFYRVVAGLSGAER